MQTVERTSVWKTLWRSEVTLPLIVGFVLRLCAMPFAHIRKPQFWEYGDIAHNLLNGYGYAFSWYYRDHGIILRLPTAYMPPGQTYVIYAGLKLFGENLIGYSAVFLEELV